MGIEKGEETGLKQGQLYVERLIGTTNQYRDLWQKAQRKLNELTQTKDIQQEEGESEDVSIDQKRNEANSEEGDNNEE